MPSLQNLQFEDVQLFFEFLSVLNDADKRKTILGTDVDLLSNLDPSGNTNTAIEIAKIYSWYNKIIDYDPSTNSFFIKEDVLPDKSKTILAGYYDSDNDIFYSDSAKTKPMTKETNRLYIDTPTGEVYRYDAVDDGYKMIIGEDTKYQFQEGNVTGAFQVSEDGGAWQSIKVHDVATLDADGKIPSSQLPSFVDDVLEGTYDETTGVFTLSDGTVVTNPESGKIYTDIQTNISYRWGGTKYTRIASDLALGETSSTAYYGDKGKVAYDHSQLTTGNPHNVTKDDVGLGNVDNTADADKNVLSATKLTNARTIDGVEFDGQTNIIHYGECTTASGTAIKTVDCTGFALTKGAWISVKFENINSAPVDDLKLNINATGAKSIKQGNANLQYANILGNNKTYLFVYDGVQYQLVGDTDINVKQTPISSNENHPILMAYSKTDSSVTVDNVTYKVNSVYINPSTGSLYTTNLYAESKVVADTIETSSGGQYANTDNILILHCNNKPELLT